MNENEMKTPLKLLKNLQIAEAINTLIVHFYYIKPDFSAT